MKNVRGCSLFLLGSYSCFSCVLGVPLIIGVDENTMLIEMVTAGKYTRCIMVVTFLKYSILWAFKIDTPQNVAKYSTARIWG